MRFFKPVRRFSPWRRPGAVQTRRWARHAWLVALCALPLLLTACQGQGPNGWGWPQPKGEAPQAARMPMQPNSDFGDRLSEITQRLDQGEAWQSGPDQPAGTNINAPVEKAPLAAPGVKVALIVPMSGPSKALGDSMIVAGQMALQDLRATSIQLMPRDSGTTPASASDAVKKAVADGAQLILGPVFADQVKSASSTAASSHVPLIGFTTDTGAAGSSTFVMGFLPEEQVMRVLGFARERGASDYVVIAPDTPYGRMVGRTAQTFQGLPGTVIVAAPGDTPATMSVKLKTVLTPKTALLMAYDGATVRRLVSALASTGITTQNTLMLGTGLLDDPQLANAREIENVFFASAPTAQRARFDSRYRGMAGKAPERLASLAYDATALSVVVAQAGGGQFPLAQIKDPNGFAGIDGIFRFRGDGLVQRGLAVLTWTAGNLREVAPAPKSF